MSEFTSQYAYWEFARTVRGQRRWILDASTTEFLNSVRKASHSRERVLKSGHPLWRCQRGSKPMKKREYPKDRKEMIPNSQFIKGGGRANPPGFVYLYLATDPATAMAEMRPWVGESLSVALFKIQKDVPLVLCDADIADPFERICLSGQKPSSEKVDTFVWSDISTAFARPVTRDDTEIDYVPTQILAEVFREEGFGGVAYKSGLSRGLNVVLFDVRIAKPVQYFLYALRNANFTFAADDPQFTIHSEKDGVFEYLEILTSESP